MDAVLVYDSLDSLLILCLFAFLAGFIDSVVGGGGLVQIPAFFVLFPHLSVPSIIGTNRLASAVGTSVAAFNYLRSVRLPWTTVMYAAISAAVCSYSGALVQSQIPTWVMKPVIFILILLIAVYTYTNKQFGDKEQLKYGIGMEPWAGAAIGGVLGLYNGLIGPGTGSLLVFGFVSILGYSFLRASAISKIVNVVADASSLVFFISSGYVLYHLAIPMMVCNVAGSYVGSRMAVLRGNTFIRGLFLLVIFGVLVRFAWDIYGMMGELSYFNK